MISSEEMLYRLTAFIQLDANNNCARKLIKDSDLSTAHGICKFTSLTPAELIVTIVDSENYFVASNKPSTLWQTCDGEEEQIVTPARYTIQLAPGCMVKSPSFIMRAHKTYTFNQTKIVIPRISSNASTLNRLIAFVNQPIINLNLPHQKPIFVHNEGDMQELIQEANLAIAQAQHQYERKTLVYDWDLPYASYFTIGATINSLLSILVISIKFGLFGLFGCLFSCCCPPKWLSSHAAEAPRSILKWNDHTDHHREYPSTPHPPNRIRHLSTSNQEY